MKNFILFVLLILFITFLGLINNHFITTDSKIFDFLAKDYPSYVVQNYMDNQKKWWWVSYAVTPLLIGIKVLLVAFCLNFIKLFEIEGLEKIKFSDLVFVVLIAEFVFVIAGFYKFINFYWINTNYTVEDLQTYFPISLLNLKEHISTEKWLAYPLQIVNFFELFYCFILAWGVRELLQEKISYFKSFGLVAITYGVGLMFWVGVVCFMILNASY